MATSVSVKHLAASILLGFSSVVNAVGQAIVVNHCNFPAYLWSVSNVQGPLNTLSPNGGTYSEEYQINPAGGGVSIKIGTTDSIGGSIIQFEYTYLDTLWYDLSRINGSPFGQHDLTLIPSDSSCEGVYCRPNGYCGAGNVFYQPYDNSAIKACDASTNLVFSLCSSRGNGQQHQPPAPAPAPSSAPTNVPNGVPGGTSGFSSISVPGSSPASPSAPPALAPQPVPTSAPNTTPAPAPAPVAGQPLTTFVTEYVTVQATVDKIVTVTAKY